MLGIVIESELFIKSLFSFIVLDHIINEEKQVLFSIYIQFFNILNPFKQILIESG